MTKQDPAEGRQRERSGRRETKGDVRGDKPRNHEGTGPSRRETKRHPEQPGNHEGTGSSGERETSAEMRTRAPL